ncbi:MAG TPA: APC family permease [Anaeromyxobacteraceae bacterium]|nr:APC family permease [Anaeromyxobacteraceae bacterium]
MTANEGGDPASREAAPGDGGPVPERRSLRRILLGAPRDIHDPQTYHHVSLIALLAWVGLGADGLSSSAYGPDELYRAIGNLHFLAPALALATAGTVILIAIAYSRIIEHFPFGGGGYVVATRLLGPGTGLVSGSALLVDYVLTISVSIAAGGEAIWSFLNPALAPWKVPVEGAAIVLLVLINLRGVKESVSILAPIFVAFLVTHAILIVGGVGGHLGEAPAIAGELAAQGRSAAGSMGWAALAGVFVYAYSMGAGTYTGIEAVSNGLQIMREPRVATAKRTMAYMAISLSLTAGGILVAYLLFRVAPVEGKTMNAVLLEAFAGHWSLGGLPVGRWFVTFTLATEAALLLVAAQAGFLDGPRVMANMAVDGWLPHRFASLSDRLVTQSGVVLMGGASLATLLVTRGHLDHLVTMYSINVFVTFSLSQAAMLRFQWTHREPHRTRDLVLHGLAFLLCAGILAGIVSQKFLAGGWVTLVVTGGVVALCLRIRRHYRDVQVHLRRLNAILAALPAAPSGPPRPLDPGAPTAVMLVGSYTGLGVHALLTVQRLFPGHFKNVIFVSVGVVDAAAMKGVAEVERVRERTEAALRQYVDLAQRLGWAAGYRLSVATEALSEAERIALEIHREFPRSVFFAGKLIFRVERFYQRLLHNETAYALQRRLQFAGMNAMVLPVRVTLEEPA